MRTPGWGFHPLALAGAFVLQAAVSNGLPPASFVRPLLVASMGAAILAAVLWAVARDQRVGALYATGLLLILASHDPVIEVLGFAAGTWGNWGGTIGVAVALLALIAIVVVAFDQFRRGHIGPALTRPVTSALNVFSLVLLVVVLLPAVPSVPDWFRAPTFEARDGSDAPDSPPDVYIFLLDGYARADELERLFGIDNAAFLEGLRGRGFDTDEESRTNYTYTSLTLTAMLSMDYVRGVEPGPLAERDLGEQLDEAMVSGPAKAALHEAGYEIVATAAGWEGASLRPFADRYLDRPELTDFERALLARTWLLDLPPVPSDLFFDELRARTDGVLDDAVDLAMASDPDPTFAMIHIPAPHLPIAFTADGEPSPFHSRQYLAGKPAEFGLTEEAYAAAYSGHLTHLNQRMLDTIDAVLNENASSVIVVMSDHGYNGDSPIHSAAMLHNLFASTTPDRPGLLADAPTPVNLIRAILAAYTEVNAGLPVDDRFFTTVISGTTGSYDLQLTEVTDP